MTRTIKIGFHRNSPRLWIEGKILASTGFKYGDKWRIDKAVDGTAFFLVAFDAPSTGDAVCSGSVSHRFRNDRETLIIDTHNRALPLGMVVISDHAERFITITIAAD